jgi:tight adherence protein B
MVSPLLGTVSTALLASAIEVWPAYPGRSRLAALIPSPAGARAGYPLTGARLSRLVLDPAHGWARVGGPAAALAGLLGAALGGAGGAAAGVMAGGLAGYRLWSANQRRNQSGELAAMLDAIGVMTSELRAGAHPAVAAEVASEPAGYPVDDSPPARSTPARSTPARATPGQPIDGASVRGVLRLIAVAARLGADVPALLRRHASAEPVIGDELSRLAAAWSLAERHGVGLAELLDAVRADLDARTRLANQINAQLAGPRSTAAVLAGLPALGILLGQGIGAQPWRILTGTPIGQALLVLGTALACAGVAWSGRITSRAVNR